MANTKLKIPFFLLSFSSAKKLGKRLRGFGEFLVRLYPKIGEIIPKLEIDIDPVSYAVGSFFSSFIYALFFFVLALVVLTLRVSANPPIQSLGIGFLFFIVFFMLHMFYPGIILKKVAVTETKDLLFALREVMMDIESGVPLFDSMKNIGGAHYGYVSKDFEWVSRQIEGGVPEREALKKLAIKSESEYLKRAIWQLVNALESGAGMNTALAAIVQTLENHLYRQIKDYSSMLNFLMLVYMLISAALPALGITLLVLLSAFGGIGVGKDTILTLIAISAVLQMILIGYMSSARPEIFGG